MDDQTNADYLRQQLSAHEILIRTMLSYLDLLDPGLAVRLANALPDMSGHLTSDDRDTRNAAMAAELARAFLLDTNQPPPPLKLVRTSDENR